MARDAKLQGRVQAFAETNVEGHDSIFTQPIDRSMLDTNAQSPPTQPASRTHSRFLPGSHVETQSVKTVFGAQGHETQPEDHVEDQVIVDTFSQRSASRSPSQEAVPDVELEDYDGTSDLVRPSTSRARSNRMILKQELEEEEVERKVSPLQMSASHRTCNAVMGSSAQKLVNFRVEVVGLAVTPDSCIRVQPF